MSRTEHISALPDYKKTAYKIIATQILLTLAIAAVLLAVVSVKSAYSALVGGLISVVSGFCLAMKLFSFTSPTPPERILRAFYVGEVVKIAITVALFTFVMVVLDTDVLFLLLSYIAALSVYWFALIATTSR